MSSSINLNVPNLDTENVKASGSLKKHVHYYSLVINRRAYQQQLFLYKYGENGIS